jgi:hypothetical protein
MTGFETQCIFKPKLGAGLGDAGKQNWELPKSQSWELCVDLIEQVDLK